jgi:hypothetical protein
MGLDTTHDCWHGAYSAFSRWRDALAHAAGYTFHEMKDGYGRLNPDLDWGNIEAKIGKDLLGKWDAIPVRPDGTPDPLIILLAHSDCEGELQVEFLPALANRLKELLPRLEELGDGGGHVGSYVEKTQTFIDGLGRAAAAGENVGFH